MKGVVQMNEIMMTIMFVLIMVAAVALIVVSVMEEPFMTLDECSSKGGSMCDKGDICPVKSYGVVREEGRVGACCPVTCVEG